MTCDQSPNIEFEMNVQNNNVNTKQNLASLERPEVGEKIICESGRVVSSILEGLMSSVSPPSPELEKSSDDADISEAVVSSFLDEFLEKIIRDSEKPWMSKFELIPRQMIPLWEPCEEWVAGKWVVVSQQRKIMERSRELETFDLSADSGKIDKSWASKPKGPPAPGSKRARYSRPVPQPIPSDSDSDEFSDSEPVREPSPKRKATPSPTMTAETLRRLRACGGISISRTNNEQKDGPTSNTKQSKGPVGPPKVNLPRGVTITPRDQNGEPMPPRRPTGMNLPSGISISPAASSSSERPVNLPPGISITPSAASNSREASRSRNSVDSSDDDEPLDSDSHEESIPPRISPEKSKKVDGNHNDGKSSGSQVNSDAPSSSHVDSEPSSSGPPSKKRKLNSHDSVEDALACLFMVGLLWARKSSSRKTFNEDTGLAVEDEDDDHANCKENEHYSDRIVNGCSSKNASPDSEANVGVKRKRKFSETEVKNLNPVHNPEEATKNDVPTSTISESVEEEADDEENTTTGEHANMPPRRIPSTTCRSRASYLQSQSAKRR